MGRTTKKVNTTDAANEESTNTTEVQNTDAVAETLPANVVDLMRLYPQYEEMWITSKGFVHPVGSPQYLLKDAKLYKNKFYNK
jgi:hypothetical protein